MRLNRRHIRKLILQEMARIKPEPLTDRELRVGHVQPRLDRHGYYADIADFPAGVASVGLVGGDSQSDPPFDPKGYHRVDPASMPEEADPEFIRLCDEASDTLYELSQYVKFKGIRAADFPKFYEAWHPWESIMSNLRDLYGNTVDEELKSMRMNPDKIPDFT